jgi:hypothetical protein
MAQVTVHKGLNTSIKKTETNILFTQVCRYSPAAAVDSAHNLNAFHNFFFLVLFFVCLNPLLFASCTDTVKLLEA